MEKVISKTLGFGNCFVENPVEPIFNIDGKGCIILHLKEHFIQSWLMQFNLLGAGEANWAFAKGEERRTVAVLELSHGVSLGKISAKYIVYTILCHLLQW